MARLKVSTRLRCLVTWYHGKLSSFYLSADSDSFKLVHAMSPEVVFGPHDKIIEGHTEAWCIAKIMNLVGPFSDHVPDNETYADEIELARQLAVMKNTLDGGMLMKQTTLRKRLEQLSDPPVSAQLLDFIDYLLVVDHQKRPTASEALQHPYLQSMN
jgi:serine/threonine protein kinase